MPLQLKATPGASDANAYADVTTADTYASYRVGGSAFSGLTGDQKIQALVTATRDIDTLGARFLGDRATSTQALEWPRTGAGYDDDELPPLLVNATIELALSYAPAFALGFSGDVLSPDPANGNIKRDKTGPLETEYFAPTGTAADDVERFPAMVQRLLAALLRPDGAGWGSAPVSRAS